MSQKKRHVQLLTDHTHRPQSPVLKRWKDLSPEDRHREIVRAASRHGGQAVTLNMAPQFADCLATTANGVINSDFPIALRSSAGTDMRA